MTQPDDSATLQGDGLERAEMVELTEDIRTKLQLIQSECDIPAVTRSANQADVFCFSILWELGAEEETTPELADWVTD